MPKFPKFQPETQKIISSMPRQLNHVLICLKLMDESYGIKALPIKWLKTN